MIVVCTIEGFLSDGPLPGSNPTAIGLQFYRTLGKAFSWVLLTESASREVAESWLVSEGINGWISLKSIQESILETKEAWKESIFKGLISSNMRPALSIESDVESARVISATGVPVLLHVPSLVSNETHTYLPWNDVADMVEERRMKKAQLAARDWNKEIE